MRRKLNPTLTNAIQQTFQRQGGVLLQTSMGAMPSSPFTDPMQIASFIEGDCGADSYVIEGTTLIACKHFDGVAKVVKRYELQAIDG
jgi:hypothetical protein